MGSSASTRFAIRLLACAVMLSACAAPGQRATSSPLPAASPPPSSSVAGSPSPPPAVDQVAARTIATIDMGGGPDFPTEAFGSIWVNAIDGPLMNDGTTPAIHRIDPETNEVVASIPLPGRLCSGVGASPEAVWACGPDGLVRIDPATNESVATVGFEAALVNSRIPYGAGSVWSFATSAVGPDQVVRIDPTTNAVTATIDLGHVAGTMAFGLDALWVSAPVDGLLLRIDPATNTVEEWSSGIDRPGSVAVGADAIWVSLIFEHGAQGHAEDATVVRIDPMTGDLEHSIVTGGALGDEGEIVATPEAIWVRAPEPWLVRIDPATNQIVDRIDTRSGPGAVAFAFDSLWVTTDRGEVLRLEP